MSSSGSIPPTAAAHEAGIPLCGPLRSANRPAYTCFQAGTEDADIRRGAPAEIRQAMERFNAGRAQAGAERAAAGRGGGAGRGAGAGPAGQGAAAG